MEAIMVAGITAVIEVAPAAAADILARAAGNPAAAVGMVVAAAGAIALDRSFGPAKKR
jgi:hypothetical protein